jgi:hypothetical protein
MGWIQGNFEGVSQGVPPEYLVCAKHYRPESVPEGSRYFALKQVIFNRTGDCALYVYIKDKSGAPLPGFYVGEGWREGKALSEAQGPAGGQIESRPNNGFCFQADSNGKVTFGWGGGEQVNLAIEEGMHWSWVSGAQGPESVYTDVVTGLAWMLATNHWHVDLVFQEYDGGVIPPDEPPPSGSIADEFDAIADAAGDIAEGFTKIQQAAGNLSLIFGG